MGEVVALAWLEFSTMLANKTSMTLVGGLPIVVYWA